MITRQDANRCRFVPGMRAGHYESYFLRANHPRRALAFWIRYTFFSPRGRPQDAVGELWAVYFDGERERIAAAREAFALTDCTIGGPGLDIRIGDARLSEACLLGSAAAGEGANAHRIGWMLGYESVQAPLLLLPEARYQRGFPQAKALVPAPSARFGGELQVDGEQVVVDGWRGSQNHNWGSRHTDTYAWGQVAGFDGAPEVFLECATARVKLGPFWTPSLTVLVLRIGSEEYALNGIGQSLCNQGRFDFLSWELRARARGVGIHLRMSAPPTRFAGLRYPDPPGGTKTCLNAKLACCELTVELPGQRPRRYRARHRAAFEILTDRQDHGVALLA